MKGAFHEFPEISQTIPSDLGIRGFHCRCKHLAGSTERQENRQLRNDGFTDDHFRRTDHAGCGQPVVTTTTAPTPVFQTVDDSYFDDALFIGDSRTEGLALYGSLTNADYFSSVGLTIFKVTEKAAGNPNTGESVTLAQKLAQKQYGKVYIMLGLNELGTGTTESWAQAYAQVIAQVRQAQPNAVIYLESILVVAASQDNPGGAINNATVNARNQALEALANPQDNIFYLNVNEAVMDANGCLDASLTSDGIHLLGNSLSLWENYLKQHAIVLGGTAVSTTAPTTYTTAVTQSTETTQ